MEEANIQQATKQKDLGIVNDDKKKIQPYQHANNEGKSAVGNDKRKLWL